MNASNPTPPARLRTWRRRIGQFLGPLLFYRIGHACHSAKLSLLGEITRFLGILIFHCDINHKATLGKRVSLPHYGLGTVIGKYATIGNECVIMPGVLIGATLRTQEMPHLKHGVVVGAGAKVLGPITVGENARIGSNAVVNKAVPAGATAVGIPGRIICKEMDADCQQEKLRQDMASKIGFDAYGMTPDMPDPIAQSIRKMLDHMHAVDEKVNAMSEALESMGSDCGKSLPEIHDDVFEEESEAASGAPAAAATKVD